jgi:hypothetical protein
VSVNVVAGGYPPTPLTLPITTGVEGLVNGGAITLREIV